MIPPASPYRPRPLPSKPVFPRWQGPVVAIAVSVALAMVTVPKLIGMYRLRGWLPGCPERTLMVGGVVRSYGHDTWALALYDDRQPAPVSYEIQVTAAQMRDFRRGTMLRVRCNEGERECFVPTSVFIDDGNIAFDKGLLAIEALGLFLGLAFLVPRLWFYARAWREFRAQLAR